MQHTTSISCSHATFSYKSLKTKSPTESRATVACFLPFVPLRSKNPYRLNVGNYYSYTWGYYASILRWFYHEHLRLSHVSLTLLPRFFPSPRASFIKYNVTQLTTDTTHNKSSWVLWSFPGGKNRKLKRWQRGWQREPGACCHGGGGPVTSLSIRPLILIWSRLYDSWAK